MVTKIFYFLLLVCSSHLLANSKLQNFQTTRVMQSAGAGVASLLINEATIFNPSTIVFIPESTLYYQKSKHKLKESDKNRTARYFDGADEFLALSDTTTPLKGGFSYLYQNNHLGKKKTYSLSSAGNVSKTTSLGFSYRYSDEESMVIDNTHHQFSVGLTNIFSESLILGALIVDPQNKIPEYSHYIIGIQYTFNSFFQFIGDIGSGDFANPEKSSISRMALQLNSFEYFYFRYGRFHDKFNNEKGISYGISWVGPNFSIDYGIKNSEIISLLSDKFYLNDKILETSFGITALF